MKPDTLIHLHIYQYIDYIDSFSRCPMNIYIYVILTA